MSTQQYLEMFREVCVCFVYLFSFLNENFWGVFCFLERDICVLMGKIPREEMHSQERRGKGHNAQVGWELALVSAKRAGYRAPVEADRCRRRKMRKFSSEHFYFPFTLK